MENIGFIGLGTMGKPMAHNLLKAGHHLTVMDQRRAQADELVAAGAAWADTPFEAAKQADIVITMLPNSPDVEAVMTGPEGVFKAAHKGLLLIDMSTISPVMARRLANEAQQRGLDLLDAPVSGTDIGAKNGSLSIMVGGQEAAFERALPILQVLGKTVLRIGDAGAGQICKAANQIITSITIAAISEALVFAAKAGADPATVRKALLGGAAQSKNLEIHGQRMLDHNFVPGFRLALHRKDLDIVLATAQEYGVPLPVTAIVHQMMNASIAAGRGDLDTSSTILMIEELANTQLTSA